MKHRRYLASLSLSAFMGLWLTLLCAFSAELQTTELGDGSKNGLNAVERSSLQPPKKEVHPATQGMHIAAAPIFVADKPASVSVLDAGNRPVAGVSLLVNGTARDTDENGMVSFTVPYFGALTLSIVDANKEEIDRKQFELNGRGWLVLSTISKSLKNLVCQSSGQTSSLSYAPAVIEVGKTFTLLGSNLAVGNGKVMLDGIPLPVLSASPFALLACVPETTAEGPLKQIYVTGRDTISSNVLEVDIARSSLSLDKVDANKSESDARLSVNGTQLPMLICITNSKPDVADLSLADGTRLGERACVLVPGGEQNALAARLTMMQPESPSCQTRLEADSLSFLQDEPCSGGTVGATKNGALVVPPALWRSLYQSQLMRLKRRLVSVQSLIADKKEQLERNAPKGSDLDVLSNGLKALSLRQDALSIAIAARKALFLDAGGTDQQFNAIMDDATSGAYFAIESQTGDTDLLLRNPLVASSSPTIAKTRLTKRLLRAMAESRIKLLLPMELDPNAKKLEALLKDNKFDDLKITQKADKVGESVTTSKPTGKSSPPDKPAGKNSSPDTPTAAKDVAEKKSKSKVTSGKNKTQKESVKTSKRSHDSRSEPVSGNTKSDRKKRHKAQACLP